MADCNFCEGKGYFECNGDAKLDCEKQPMTHYHMCYCEKDNQANNPQTDQTP